MTIQQLPVSIVLAIDAASVATMTLAARRFSSTGGMRALAGVGAGTWSSAAALLAMGRDRDIRPSAAMLCWLAGTAHSAVSIVVACLTRDRLTFAAGLASAISGAAYTARYVDALGAGRGSR